MKPVKIGVVGCGNISDIYFENAKKLAAIEVLGCADLDKARAADKAKKHGLPKAYPGVKQLLADKSIEMVLNLTIPAAHGDVAWPHWPPENTPTVKSLLHSPGNRDRKCWSWPRKTGCWWVVPRTHSWVRVFKPRAN